MEAARPSAARRICPVPPPALGEGGAQFRLIRDLGFDAVLVPLAADPDTAVASLADQARASQLQLYLDISLHRFAAEHPDAFIDDDPVAQAVADPRWPHGQDRDVSVRLDGESAVAAIAYVSGQIVRWASMGLDGVRVLQACSAPAAVWKGVIDAVRRYAPGFVFIADTKTASRDAVLALDGCGFDAVSSSLTWWDGRARWFVEEYEALRGVAPLIAELGPPSSADLATPGAQADHATVWGRQLSLTAATDRWLASATLWDALEGHGRGDDPSAPSVDILETVRSANAVSRELCAFNGEMRLLTGEGAAVTVLLRVDAPDVRRARAALLILINPDPASPASVQHDGLLARAGAEFEDFARADGRGEPFADMEAGEVRLLVARRSSPIERPLTPGTAAACAAAQAPRLVVEGVSPSVEDGLHPVRRVVGETVCVEADAFGDGHEQLAVELQWRALDQPGWRAVSMRALENDRWEASFPLERLGRYEFVVEAWLDAYGGFRRDYAKKRAAGVAQSVDTKEGCELVRRAAKRSAGERKAALKALQARFEAQSDERCGDILLEDDVAALMRAADDRPFRLRSPPQFVDAERLQARFASWYELFPRSQTSDAGRHGTFDDVIARLPAVRAMGFDVLYFPPIHPIGRKNRKGRNNSLRPAPDDPGSPYAIGSQEGGHEAIHCELGDLEDFRRLVTAAAEQGLEIALDFAIQCSPDHPWLKQHPDWFDWRPDGSIKYAENPPKKYQDIVNVDFYKPEAIPDLWLALRDIVLLWVGEGVRLFRVDNPHTKPLPFWEWMIREVRAAHPDVVFLAEAFTRPKVMYRLSKIGFSQSYTYFTWRHEKWEFIEYMTELTQTAPKEFFRPNFFVNTPDINPYFLQRSGRGGFLIRAALAATLSGLWGVYSGFELLEAEPLPGKEEYADSEKYEIRPRPARAPSDIVAEISRLNRIRKGHPALQTHLGVAFLPAWNDKVLVYAKATASLDDVVVVAVSLDPHDAQETHFDLPLQDWRLAHDAAVDVEDLIWERRFTWTGAPQHVRLSPDQPYAVWSVRLPQ